MKLPYTVWSLAYLSSLVVSYTFLLNGCKVAACVHTMMVPSRVNASHQLATVHLHTNVHFCSGPVNINIIVYWGCIFLTELSKQKRCHLISPPNL